MGYEHGLDGFIEFNEPISIEVLNNTFKPLHENFGWNWGSDNLKCSNGSFELIQDNEPEKYKAVNLSTRGYVGYSFVNDVIEPLQENLKLIAVASYLTLYDYDTGDTDDFETKFWYGDQDEIDFAKKEEAISDAKWALHEVGLDVSVNAVEIGMNETCRRKLKNELTAQHVSPFLAMYQSLFYSLTIHHSLPSCCFGFHELNEGGWAIEPIHDNIAMFINGVRVSTHQAALVVTMRALTHYKCKIPHTDPDIHDVLNDALQNLYEGILGRSDADLIVGLIRW